MHAIVLMAGACLVHDDVVDGVLLGVLVVAEPDAEALRVEARKVLRADMPSATACTETEAQC